MSLSVVVRVDKLLRLQASLQTRATDRVRENARFMRDYAAAITPVRTGALRTSWYVSGPEDETDYPERSNAARSLNPQAVIVSEVQAALFDPGVGQLRANTGRFSQPEAIVSSAVNYSLFLEEGTRYMAAQPILRPAAEATREQFISSMGSVADV